MTQIMLSLPRELHCPRGEPLFTATLGAIE